MSQVNEHDDVTPHEVGCGPRHRAADLREPTRAPAPGRALHRGPGTKSVRHAARGPGGTRPDPAGAARHRPTAGRADRDTSGPDGRRAVASVAGGLAGAATARADAAGAGDVASRSANPGEAQPVLTVGRRYLA